MAGQVWSKRFCMGAAGAYSDYMVPAGYTAVVKTACCWNGSASVQAVSLTIAGLLVWTTNVASHDGLTASGLHIVCYGGELMRAFLGGAAGNVYAGGFLLAGKAP